MGTVVVIDATVQEYFDFYLDQRDCSFNEDPTETEQAKQDCREIWATMTEVQRIAVKAICKCVFGDEPVT